MRFRMNRMIRVGLVLAGLATAAGAVHAGKSRTQFAATLTVTSECSIQATSADRVQTHSSQAQGAMSAHSMPVIDTRCSHGGQMDVKLRRAVPADFSITEVPRSVAISGSDAAHARSAPLIISVNF